MEANKSQPEPTNLVLQHSLLTEYDIYLFKKGKHFQLFNFLGSRKITLEGVEGYYFAVFAPGANSVKVIGEFNGWNGQQHRLFVRWDASGIWEGFIPGIKDQMIYKYEIRSDHTELVLEKSDPFATHCETPPKSGSITWPLNYKWKDKRWLNKRKKIQGYDQPMSIYEVHLGSWKRKDDNKFLTYQELADQLVPYVKDMGFTHVEFMPVMEHPYDLSWGYQVTGFFSPTSRFGTPQDFKFLVESFHAADIGVILDWVPSHFPSDAHGLAKFDGSYVYENPDRRKGYHPDWDSMIFNYERPEIRSFLISNAVFWANEYHIDGFRVDAVASILYLDYSRKEGEWEPNEFGGNHNLAAIQFLKDLNEYLYSEFPDIHLIAEESTSFDGVTRAVDKGGLGFGFKWMMGWMNDTLDYFSKDPIYRKHHQGQITFSMIYAFSENYVLPLSHDEVVHGKQSLVYKMPGDEWQKFANLRLLLAYMFTHPGAKLLFMGSEFGQTNEWNCTTGLDWQLLKFDPHQGIQHLVKALNQIYLTEKALYQLNYDPDGFEWVNMADHENSVIVYLRKGKNSKDQLLVVCNFTPKPHNEYKIGIETSGNWEILLNTDEKKYGGSAFKVKKKFKTKSLPFHGKAMSLIATLPPLAMIILKHKGS